jgi:putative SOS response-associated peptidase YedK
LKASFNKKQTELFYMCGRYTLAGKPVDLEKQLRANLKSDVVFRSSYNIAPGSAVLAVLNEQPDCITALKWGLTPSWSKSGNKPLFLINLRDDTLRSKPAFTAYMRNRRCIVPATGFFEWKPETSHKQPYYFHCLNHEFVYFAGVWESNGADGGNMLAIVTTEANALVGPVHSRMPVIFDADTARIWLSENNPDKLSRLLQPYPADEMECWPVSSRVNKAGIDDSGLIEKTSSGSSQQSTLF